MTDAELDQLAINTIRTLSIDAVQAANSGHPGTPMALAPLVYTLWNRVMRFDPQDPIWPGRDRFVLSNGHASMLLWSVLYLTDTQAVNAEYETLGRPACHPRRYPALSPAWESRARASRIPPGIRRGDDHRPARTRHCDQRRYGESRSAGSRRVTTSRISQSSITISMPYAGRLPDGGRRL
jgi:hypothetical protein